MAQKLYKNLTILQNINHNMNDGFKLDATSTQQCANIESTHHKRVVWNDRQGKYYVLSILRVDKDGRFKGYGSSLKTKKMVY